MITLRRFYVTRFTAGCRSSNELSLKLQCLPSTVSAVPALHTSAAFALHSLKLVEERGFVLRIAGTYECHLRGQNLANAVSELLHPEHGTLYRYISVRQPSADNTSSLGSKLISSNAPTRTIGSELTYLLTYLLIGQYRIILLHDRAMCVNNLPRIASESAPAGSRTCRMWC